MFVVAAERKLLYNIIDTHNILIHCGGFFMDILHELYDTFEHCTEAETALLEVNKKLMEYVENNIPDTERTVFLETIESIMKCREQYFFQAGFNTAKELLLK